MKVTRFDNSTLEGAVRTPQGFLKAPAVLTRVGVFKYKKPDGSILRELRHPDDVFHPDSLATLSSVPLTNDHPGLDLAPEGLVTPENVQKLQVGISSESVESLDQKFVKGFVTVMDSQAIMDVERGKTELSMGYVSEMIEESGEFNGEPYDCRQINIRYNHVALVDVGRAGPDVRLRLDSDAVIVTDDLDKPDKEIVMEKVMINGQEFEMSPEAAKAVKGLLAEMEGSEAVKADAQKKLDEEAAKVAAAEGEKKVVEEKLDTVQAKLDATEEKLKVKMDSADLTPEKIQAEVTKRILVLEVGRHVVKTDGADLEKMSNLDIMKEVVKAKSKTDLTGKSEAYVVARFDAITEEVEEDVKKKREVTSVFEKHFDSTEPAKGAAEEARKRQTERTLNQHKTK